MYDAHGRQTHYPLPAADEIPAVTSDSYAGTYRLAVYASGARMLMLSRAGGWQPVTRPIPLSARTVYAAAQALAL